MWKRYLRKSDGTVLIEERPKFVKHETLLNIHRSYAWQLLVDTDRLIVARMPAYEKHLWIAWDE